MAEIAGKEQKITDGIQAASQSEAAEMLNKAYIGMVEDGFKQLVKSAEAQTARDRSSTEVRPGSGNDLVRLKEWTLFAPCQDRLTLRGDQRGKEALRGGDCYDLKAFFKGFAT